MEISSWTPEYFINNETECRRIVEAKWNMVPLANVRDMHDFTDGTLIRFNGMVQDMHNPEYYLSNYEILNESTSETNLRNGKYIDVACCKIEEIINTDSDKNITSERSTIIVVSTPGINDWVLDVQKEPIEPKPSTSSAGQYGKRNLDEGDTEIMDIEITTCTSSNKKPCVEERNAVRESNQVISQEYLLNFPIPERPGKVFIVKVYADSDRLKINDNVEFMGFLSLNPSLGQTGVADDEEWRVQSEMEVQTRNPPPSLIPRLHCISFRPMRHCNPLSMDASPTNQERFRHLRKELHIVLTQLLLADELAAEYLIYYLMSEIYLRKDLTALGKFTLNISNIPAELASNYGHDLYDIIQSLVPNSHYLPMTLDKMNDSTFIPRKDYDCNRLTSGMLQLSKNTRLVIDETKLTPGKINESGLRAIGALAKIIKEQQLAYDFKFYNMDFDTDIPCLVLSEGKSMLPSDFHVVLKPEDVSVTTFTETVAAAKVFLNTQLTELRVYLTKARTKEYELTDNVQAIVENHFVEMRRQNNVTGDDLHKLLVLGRLICLSEGKSNLDEECWHRACQLETDRKERLKK